MTPYSYIKGKGLGMNVWSFVLILFIATALILWEQHEKSKRLDLGDCPALGLLNGWYFPLFKCWLFRIPPYFYD